MSIQCQQCAYVMTQAEVMGYMSAEIYNVFKYVILPCLIAAHLKRDLKSTMCEMSEDIMIGFLNYYIIKCHVCHEYKGWSCNKSS